MQIGVLGSLEVVCHDGPVALTAAKQRALLAFLALHVGEVVSVDRLVDGLWGAEPPRTAETSLQNLVARLRQALGADVIATRPPGYVLTLDPSSVDAVRFERLLARARAAAPAEQHALLVEALALWRGPA